MLEISWKVQIRPGYISSALKDAYKLWKN